MCEGISDRDDPRFSCVCHLWGDEPRPCERCEGKGRIPVGEYFVTREMAIDGGDRAMEGMSMGIEYGECHACNGSGEASTERTRGET